MFLTEIAFYLFALTLISSAIFVVMAQNPVHSVLFLIMAFFNAAALFILMGAEFLAMILLIVYIGAVAVLFLFVVMMLDIDFTRLREGFWQYLPVGLLLGVFLLGELIFLLQSAPTMMESLPAPPAALLAEEPNIETLGNVLYTRYIHFFQAAGLILLIAMIGAIALTLRPRPNVRRQDPARQSARRREDSLEIKKVYPGEGL